MATSTPKSVSLPSAGPARSVAVVGRSPARRAWGRLRRNPAAMAGGLVLAIMGAVALVVPRVVAIDPYQQSLIDSLLPPGTAGHPLGTDHLGRDVLLRLIDGARVSLAMGFIAVGVAVVVGGLIGFVAGYFGGFVDGVLMRLIEVQLTFPGILAALVIVTVLGSGLAKAMVAVGIPSVPRFARVVRGAVLAAKHECDVEAARATGATHRRIMFIHIAPQALSPTITLATLGLANAILAGAALSFLGLGPQPPTAEWGLMLADGRKYLQIAWWLGIFPGLAINLLGDGLHDALDPRV